MSTLCLFITSIIGQESVGEYPIKLKSDSFKIFSNKNRISFERSELSSSPTNNAKGLVDKTKFELVRPFYILPYYINPSPMHYGDYSTSGCVLSHFYGSGSQTILPGIGRINQVSLMFQYPLNDFFETQLGINATKYYFPRSVGQSFGVSGALIYHPNEKLKIKAFGLYTPTYRYDFYRNAYGITVGYAFTDQLEMEVGVQNYYNPQKGWRVAPIAIPRYKFKRCDIGIDVGGLLYETIRNAANK